MPTGSELQTPPPLMTPPHGRMLAAVSWLCKRVALLGHQQEMKWQEASEVPQLPRGLPRVLGRTNGHSLHTGRSLSCLLHGSPEASLQPKLAQPAPSQCIHQLPPAPCISTLSVVSQQAPVSHSVHSRGLKTGSRLRRRPFLPLPSDSSLGPISTLR